MESLTANLATLTQQRDMQVRICDLQTRWTALETDAAQQGCHLWHVTGYQRIVAHLLTFKHEQPADMPPNLIAAIDKHHVWDEQATQLHQDVQKIMAFDARRRAVVKAADKWTPETPLTHSRLTRYGRWARAAPKMIAERQQLTHNPLLSPDDRKILENALERITASLDGCGLEAKHLGRFETTIESADAQGCHRFFVKGYDRFIIGLRKRTTSPERNTLALREFDVQKTMRMNQRIVHKLDRDLNQALQERETGGEAFVAEMFSYDYWERNTTEWLHLARNVLHDQARYDIHLDRVRGLKRRIHMTATKIETYIKQDAPIRKDVKAAFDQESERKTAKLMQQIKSRSRSRGLGL